MSFVDLAAPEKAAVTDGCADRRQVVTDREPHEPPPPRPRALVVSDRRRYRDALQRGLGESGTAVDVVGASGTEDADDQVRRLDPDVVVLDAAERPSAAALVRSVKASVPGLSIVVITPVRDEAEVLAWAEAGVSGYADQNSSADDLAAAVRLAARGEVLCSPRLAALLASRAAER